MKSICIKTNNPKSIEYLLEQLNNVNLENVYFSCKDFRNYRNIIVHFTGRNEKLFFQRLSNILTYMVLDLFEPKIINYLISSEYFYFDNIDKITIANNTIDDLYDDEESIYPKDEILESLYNTFYNYLSSHRSIFLNGFITFRLKDYVQKLAEQVDKSINKFLIEREYDEFISLLRMYINTEPSSCDIVHLVYSNSKSVLLDNNKNVIQSDDNILNAKYLSDISFSSNDYALNTLLTLLPNRIYIHLIDNKIDEFITTIKLIFENRVTYCNDCDICQIYKKGVSYATWHMKKN